MRLSVDRDKCQGHGKCYMLAPDLFEPDENDDWGRPNVLVPEFTDDDTATLTRAKEALSMCPEFAIELHDRVSTS